MKLEDIREFWGKPKMFNEFKNVCQIQHLKVKYSSKYQGNYRPISLIQKYQKKEKKHKPNNCLKIASRGR